MPSLEGRSKTDEAEDFLADVLSDGPLDVKQIERRAKAEKLSMRTVERAKSKLGINSTKSGKTWLWKLPPGNQVRQPDDEDRHMSLGGVLPSDESPDADEDKNITPPKHLYTDTPEKKNAANGVYGGLGGVAAAGGLSEKEYALEERAAIMEHEGGLTPEGADFHGRFIRPDDVKTVPLFNNGIRIKPKFKPLAERALPTAGRLVVPVEYEDSFRLGADGVLNDAEGGPLF